LNCKKNSGWASNVFEVKKVFIEKTPQENADWAFARNSRALLRNSIAEFSISTYSANASNFTSPNRDYPYEGLSALINGENWKFLDAVGFSLTRKSETLKLTPKNVLIFPYKAIYCYQIGEGKQEGELIVEYYLLRLNKIANLNISFKIKGLKQTELRLLVEPYVDIRHMYLSSIPSGHQVEELPNGISISREGKTLLILSKNPLVKKPALRTQNWKYKLGSGGREFIDGQLCFTSEERPLFVPGYLELSFIKNGVSLQFQCMATKKPRNQIELKEHDEKTFIAKLTRIQKPFLHQLKRAEAFGTGNQLALQGRLLALIEGFDFETSEIRGPDAGAFWFRNMWFRDLFLGIHANFDIYYLTKKAYVKSILLSTFKLMKHGLVPNKLSEKKDYGIDYSSADATLLCFLCSLEYLKRTPDKILQAELKLAVKSFLQSLSLGNVRLENFLLKTPANFSWIDSKYPAKFFGSDCQVPCRIPFSWAEQLAASSQNYEELSVRLYSPRYYLVEINALWIRFLKDFQNLFPASEFETLESNASINFKSFFFSDTMTSIIDDSYNKSDELCSASIYSASLLPELFSHEEAAELIKRFETSLVYRNRKLFGVLTRNTPNRIFLGDPDYHGAVIWPRESIDLFKILHRIHDSRAKELLESNLEHQMEEGAIFYNHELFALPEGPNPSPCATSYSPVPVRNPAQFWSQWVQPYFDYLEKEKRPD
jgi:glycogen debranching enzyme